MIGEGWILYIALILVLIAVAVAGGAFVVFGLTEPDGAGMKYVLAGGVLLYIARKLQQASYHGGP